MVTLKQATKASKDISKLLQTQKPVRLISSDERCDPEILIGRGSFSSNSSLVRNPLRIGFDRFVRPNMFGHYTLRALIHYASDFESPFAEQVFSTQQTSIKLNLIYLHAWLLEHHVLKGRMGYQIGKIPQDSTFD